MNRWLVFGICGGICHIAAARVITVSVPQTIQSAINRAKPGDTVRVMPGLYKETVFVDKDRVRLSGVIAASGPRRPMAGSGR